MTTVVTVDADAIEELVDELRYFCPTATDLIVNPIVRNREDLSERYFVVVLGPPYSCATIVGGGHTIREELIQYLRGRAIINVHTVDDELDGVMLAEKAWPSPELTELRKQLQAQRRREMH